MIAVLGFVAFAVAALAFFLRFRDLDIGLALAIACANALVLGRGSHALVAAAVIAGVAVLDRLLRGRGDAALVGGVVAVIAWLVVAKLVWGDAPVPYVANVKRLALVLGLAFGPLAVAALPRLALPRADAHLAIALGGCAHVLLLSPAGQHVGAYLPLLPIASVFVLRALPRSRALLVEYAAMQVVVVGLALAGVLP